MSPWGCRDYVRLSIGPPSFPALGISQLTAKGEDSEAAWRAVRCAGFFSGRRGMTASSWRWYGKKSHNHARAVTAGAAATPPGTCHLTRCLKITKQNPRKTEEFHEPSGHPPGEVSRLRPAGVREESTPPQKIHGFHSFQPPYKGFLCRSAIFNVCLSVASAGAACAESAAWKESWMSSLLEGTLAPQGREELTFRVELERKGKKMR